MTTTSHGAEDLHVVTLAASAGGLDALKRFLAKATISDHVAYVVIQHLDPTHESLFPELLQRVTDLSVAEVKGTTPLEGGHVYVIPPGRYLELKDGQLTLTEPTEQRGRRMAIDHFLRSLAEAAGPRAICCILSGSGTDGSLGAKAIKEAGGIVLVQDPKEAGFDGMPHSAIGTRLADRVLSVDDMPALAAEYMRGEVEGTPAPRGDGSDLQRVLQLVQERTGYDFRGYKDATLIRRVHRRMRLLRLKSPQLYIDRLIQDEEEVHALRKDLLISVTHFYRDREVFQALARHVLPGICDQLQDDQSLRVWVPAVATGEEAYALAILIHEHFALSRRPCRLQIFATDVDTDALDTARAGWYPRAIEADVSPERLKNWFYSERGGYRVRKVIRESVTFAEQNVLEDPPYSRLDMISCRNLMIYLDANVQQQIASLFHFALKPDGVLVLGPAEAIAQRSKLFKAVDSTHRIYRKLDVPGRMERPLRLSPFERQRKTETRASQAGGRLDGDLLADAAHRAMARHERLCVAVLDADLSLQYVLGDPRPYLEVPQGMIDRHLGNLVREGLRAKVRMILHNLAENDQQESQTSARLKIDDADYRVQMTARRVEEERELIACTFECREAITPAPTAEEIDGAEAAAAHIAELERELRTTREDLNATIQQLETTNEELRASNEEVVSVNEELQSTNEELETSKEELQSVNEELTTVNQQLQDKMAEVSRSHDDMANLLASTKIATVFLDWNLQIRRTTAAADELLNTRPTDVGRKLQHFVTMLEGVDVAAEAGAVLEEEQPREREVRGTDGLWYSLRVLPYRNSDGDVDGVVVTLIDIDRLKRTQEDVERERNLLDTVLDTLPAGLIIADAKGRITRDNAATRELWGVPLGDKAETWEDYGEIVGWWPDTGERIKAEEWAMTRALLKGETTRNELILNQKFGSEEKRYYLNNVAPVRDAHGRIIAGVAAMLDVTERIEAEQAARESDQRYRLVVENMSEGLAIFDGEANLLYQNPACLRIHGFDPESRPEIERDQLPGHFEVRDLDGRLLAFERWVVPRVLGGEEIQNLVLHVRRPDNGREWYASYSGVPIYDADHKISQIFLTFRDISQEVQAQADLRESEQRLGMALRATDLGTHDYDVRRGVVQWDQRAREIFGIAGDEPFDIDRFWDCVVEEDRSATEARVAEAFDPEGDGYYEADYRIVPFDGAPRRWVRATGQAVFAEHEGERQAVRLVGTVRDITEQRNTEHALQRQGEILEQQVEERTQQLRDSREQVRRLHHLAATAEQRERRRIAEGLHDDVQQLLAAVRLGLSRARTRIEDGQVRTLVENADQWTGQALNSTRSLIFDLSPAVLYEMGLDAAIRNLVNEMEQRFDLTVTLQMDGALDPVDESLRVFLYTAVRELLFNVIKHAGVEKATIQAGRQDGLVTIVVRDDGKGFGPDEIDGMTRTATDTGSTLGLNMLQERIRHFEGRLEIRSAPNEGCEIRLEAPAEATGA